MASVSRKERAVSPSVSRHSVHSLLQGADDIATKIAHSRITAMREQKKLDALQDDFIRMVFAMPDARDPRADMSIETRRLSDASKLQYRMHCKIITQKSGSPVGQAEESRIAVLVPSSLTPVSFAGDCLRTIANLDSVWAATDAAKTAEGVSMASDAASGPGTNTRAQFRSAIMHAVCAKDFDSGWSMETVGMHGRGRKSEPSVVVNGSDLRGQRTQKLLHKVWKLPGATPDSAPYTVSVYYSDVVDPFELKAGADMMRASDHHLRRSVRQCSEAMHHYGIAPRELYVSMKDDDAKVSHMLRVLVTPTTQSHRNALDVTRVSTTAATPQMGDSVRILGRMLNVSVIGIQNDHDPAKPSSNIRRFSLQEVGWTPHNRFGVHDMHYISFAVPRIKEYARWIGEVHMMTQVAKSILKTRADTSSDSVVAMAVAEQRGAQLKDEGKLCAYWAHVRGLLDADEERCLQRFISHLKAQPSIISVTYNKGSLAQTCEPVGFDENKPKVKALNRMSANVMVKGGCNVSIESLGRSESVLRVRINNKWDIEMSSLSFD